MATATTTRTRKWINLNDSDGAKLEVGKLRSGHLVLVLSNIPSNSTRFAQAIRELGFTSSAAGRLMVRTLKEGDPIPLEGFRAIWPQAKIEEMPISQFQRDIQGELDRIRAQRARRESELAQQDEGEQSEEAQKATQQAQANKAAQALIAQSTYLGLNPQKEAVYYNEDSGRFKVNYYNEVADIRYANEQTNQESNPAFLLAKNNTSIEAVAKAYVQHNQHGEQAIALDVFANNVLLSDPEKTQTFYEAVYRAALNHLLDEYPNAQQAWQEAVTIESNSADLSERLGITPLPLALTMQRFLEKTPTVTVLGHADPNAYSALPSDSTVIIEGYDPALSDLVTPRPQVHTHINEKTKGALISHHHKDATGLSEQLQAMMNITDENALSVLLTNAPLSELNGAIDALGNDVHRVQLLRIPTALTGDTGNQYLCVLKRGDTEGYQLRKGQRAVTIDSWNSLRTVTDETLARMGREDLALFGEDQRAENTYQRPYMAFSQSSASRTMTPKNLLTPLRNALELIEKSYGPVDSFVSEELGIGESILSERFSAEQVDAVALGINALLNERGLIVGDETGVGKGRTLAAIGAWANKNDKPIIFITDRSTLFSDFVRDLKDIDEWERFKPLITNSDGDIFDIMNPSEDGRPLVAAPTPTQLRRIMNGQEASGHNIIFSTYSQMNIEGSTKSQWLLEQAKDAVLILDEAHVGAGANSNISRQLESMIDVSSGVIYSSATWAKDHKNLSIYKKALPASVSMSQVEELMEKEGESFSEVFSSMLASDGAFIRREHDLSNLTIEMSLDETNYARNREVLGQVSKVLSLMAILSGETSNMIQRVNNTTRRTLIDAQSARIELLSRLNNELRENEEAVKEMSERLEVWSARLASQPDERLAEAIESLTEELREKEARVNQLKTSIDKEKRAGTRGNLFKSRFGTGSASYRVIRRTNMALLVDHAANEAIKALENNQKPVITLEETAGAFVEGIIEGELERTRRLVQSVREQHEKGELNEEELMSDEIVQLLDEKTRPIDVVKEIRLPTLRDLLFDTLNQLGGVSIEEVDINEDENERVQTQSTTSLSEFIRTHYEGTDAERLVERYSKAIDEIAAYIKEIPDMPISPFDALTRKIEEAGFSVGEISGREYALVRSDKTTDATGRIVRRDKSKQNVTQSVAAFNAGKLDVLIVNKAAATGLSMHASPRFKDQRQRVLIEAESDPNPNTRLQLLGRVNRYDQVVSPIIVMPSLGMPSELRTMMMQNKKMQNLSANVRSSRDNAIINQEVPDILNATGDRVCKEYLLDNSGIMSRLGFDLSDIEQHFGLARRLTSALALLGPDQEERVFQELEEAYKQALVEEEIAYSSRVIPFKDLRAKEIESIHAWGSEKIQEGMSAFNAPVYQKIVTYDEALNPINWDEAMNLIQESTQQLTQDQRIKPALLSADHKAPRRDLLTYNFADFNKELNELSPEQKQSAIAAYLLSSERLNLLKGELPDELKGQRIGVVVPELGANSGHYASMLISSSGKTAKLWLATKAEEGQSHETQAYHIDLAAFHQHLRANYGGHANAEFLRTFSKNMHRAQPEFIEGVSQCMKPLVAYQPQRYDYNDQEGAFRRAYDTSISSVYPNIPPLDLSEPLNAAVQALEAKKIIALSSLKGVRTIEEALAAPGHNAVKEAHQRQMFVEETLSKLRLGALTQADITTLPRRFTQFFSGKTFMVTGIHVPPKGMEGSLNKWSVDLLYPGAEKPVTISAATLKQFKLMTVKQNILEIANEGLRNSTQNGYRHFNKGVVTRTASLLVGNDYQATQWARASRQGRAIVYTDENGQSHRAVEVYSSALHQGRLNSIVQRLYDEQSTLNLLNRLFDERDSIQYSVRCKPNHHNYALNVSAAIEGEKEIKNLERSSQGFSFQRNVVLPNTITVITTGGEDSSHAININLSTNAERTAWRNRYENTLRTLERLHYSENENTDDDSEAIPYLASHRNFQRLNTIRAGKNQKHRTIQLVVPAGSSRLETIARQQILEAFIQTNGAELVSMPTFSTAAKLLQEELNAHYERESQPDIERHQALIERFKSRERQRELLNNAFNESADDEASTVDEMESFDSIPDYSGTHDLFSTEQSA